MVKYEFMGAHGRGSENKGAAKHKVGGDAKKKRVAKKMWCTHPPAAPVYAYENILRLTRIYVWALYTT